MTSRQAKRHSQRVGSQPLVELQGLSLEDPATPLERETGERGGAQGVEGRLGGDLGEMWGGPGVTAELQVPELGWGLQSGHTGVVSEDKIWGGGQCQASLLGQEATSHFAGVQQKHSTLSGGQEQHPSLLEEKKYSGLFMDLETLQ